MVKKIIYCEDRIYNSQIRIFIYCKMVEIIIIMFKILYNLKPIKFRKIKINKINKFLKDIINL
jgi:hypothetical protein